MIVLPSTKTTYMMMFLLQRAARATRQILWFQAIRIYDAEQFGNRSVVSLSHNVLRLITQLAVYDTNICC